MGKMYQNLTRNFAVALLVMAASVSCSKKESKVAAPVPPPTTGGGSTGGGGTTPTNGGATADLTVVSQSMLEAYAGRRINNPTNIKINIDVFDVADSSPAQFGGDVKISYIENGSTVQGRFSSGTSEHDTRYNKWYYTGGKNKLKMFFQDSLGAVIVIVEQVTINDLETTFRGDVYFRNFDFGVCSNPPPWMPPQCAPQSPSKCWNISAGPYDCRAFMSSGSVHPETVDLPGFGSDPDGYNGPGYQRLGSFQNLDVNRALNITN